MKRRYDYAWEKYFVAVSTLAEGDAGLRTRLRDAYVHSIMRLLRQDVPPELLEDHNYICRAFSIREAVGEEGDATASANALDELQAKTIAEKIVSVFNRLASMQGAADFSDELKRTKT